MVINEIWGGYSDNVKFVKDKTLRVLVPYVIVGLFHKIEIFHKC